MSRKGSRDEAEVAAGGGEVFADAVGGGEGFERESGGGEIGLGGGFFDGAADGEDGASVDHGDALVLEGREAGAVGGFFAAEGGEDELAGVGWHGA